MRLTGKESLGKAFSIVVGDNPEIAEILHRAIIMDFSQVSHILLNLDDRQIYGEDIRQLWLDSNDCLEVFQAKLLDGFCMPSTGIEIKHCAICHKEIKDCIMFEVVIPHDNRRVITRFDTFNCMKIYIERIDKEINQH